MASTKDKIVEDAKRLEEDCLFSSKGHFWAARRWGRSYWWISGAAALLAGLAGAIALSPFEELRFIAGILAILATTAATVATFLNPSDRANVHLSAGNKYNSLRNKTRIFYEIEMDGERSLNELIERLKELSNLRDELNLGSPQIPDWAYKQAKKSIERGEADYEVDIEAAKPL